MSSLVLLSAPRSPIRVGRLGRVTIGALALAMLTLSLGACGVASISPIVTYEQREFDPALLGTWRNTEGKETAVITGDADSDYQVTYVDDEGDTARFKATLGRLGQLRVLDIEPDPAALGEHSAYFASLVLLMHSFVVIDRVTATELRFRMVEPDSLGAVLGREPGLVAHRPGKGEQGPVITAQTSEVRRFFSDLVLRPGVLSDSAVYRRR